MSLGISEEHLALHETARRWVEAHCPPKVPRSLLDAEDEGLPSFWDDLAAVGWLGLHLSEEHGGEGYGLAELAVVLEELGRAVAPGPFLPTVLASALIQEAGDETQRGELLADPASGRTAAVAFTGAAAETSADGDDLVLAGSLRPVLGAGMAELLVVPVDSAGREVWCVVDRSDARVTLLPTLDPTRRMAEVGLEGVRVTPARQLPALDRSRVVDVVTMLLGAESVGGADWCVDAAASYAKVREQFGRPIGQFQGVKHRCADMLCALEQARAAVWDAVRGGDPTEVKLCAAVVGALVPEAYARCAKDCVQVHGGIGFTWEHDAHLYLKRALAVRQLVGGAHAWRSRVAGLAAGGARRTLTIDLPPEAEEHRAEVRAFLDDLKQRDKADWDRVVAEAGYIAPYWPKPWGRDAGPVEQLVIDDEFREARVRRPHLQVGAWVLPTLIAHGTEEQQERWIRPTLRGEIFWCQMFSEPGAGSDLASLSTKAARTDGGWLLTGQKVWTTMAHVADWGICLARTDSSAPKHDGITCFMLDMKSEGIEIRPLRELTGQTMFNEVFMSDVFVPDDCVVGGVHNGWKAARTTLANERVSMGSGSSFGPGVEGLLPVAGGDDADPVDRDRLGGLVAEAHAHAVMGLRATLRALEGHDAGAESSVKKLVGVELEQRVQEFGLELRGADGAVDAGDASMWIAGFLGNRALTIAGGTSEVQRNVIAERLLGLPKDP